MLGVSTDPIDTLKRFREATGVPFRFASDAKKEVTKVYGVRRRFPLPSTRRVTYVIDRSGTIQAAFQHEIAIGRHVSEVLDCLAKLESAKPGERPCV